MWTCPKCGEKIEDQFDSCWKCAESGVQVGPGGVKEKIGDGPPSMPSKQSESKEFEFDEAQNETIYRLASCMAWFSAVVFVVGLILILAGVLKVLNGHDAADIIIAGAICGINSWLIHSTSNSFKAIITSKGNDLSHLMHALKVLDRLFRVQLYVFLAFGIGELLKMITRQ